MAETEKLYYERREQQERMAALQAFDEAARDAHLILAERYADLVWREDERDGRP